MRVHRSAGVVAVALMAVALGAAGCRSAGEVAAAARAQGGGAPGEAPVVTSVLTVDAQGGGDYASIQAAVDAAPAGGTVRVRPGTYHECVEVRKPLAIVGDGPGTTVVISSTPWAGSVREFVAQAQQAQAQGGEAGRTALAELLHAYARPAVLVADAEGVSVRGLKLTLLSPDGDGLSLADAVVVLDHAKAQVAGCVLAGAWSYGVKVGDGSALTLSDSLVAAVILSGVAVNGSQDMGPVDLRGTDFRRCGTGVEITSDSPVTVEDCRFLECELAGVRFERSAPVIRHNAFVQTHQGVAGWSDAGASIRDNVFCLSDAFALNIGSTAKTQIEQNTFASNAFGVVVLRKPFGSAIRANIFSDNGVAVLLPEDWSAAPAAGAAEGEIVGNIFWRNSLSLGQLVRDEDTNTQSTRSLPPPARNETANPLFRDAPNLDYGLQPDSPAVVKKIGAQDPLPTASRWPEQREETQMPRDEAAPLGGQSAGGP